MATSTVSLDRDGSRFVALTGSGHVIVMDNAEGDSGRRRNCSSSCRPAARPWTRPRSCRVRIVHVVEGPVEIEAVRRAIALSATKYCKVTGNLASGVTEIHHVYLVHGADTE